MEVISDLHSVRTHPEVNLGGLGGSHDPGGGINTCIPVLEAAKNRNLGCKKNVSENLPPVITNRVIQGKTFSREALKIG